MSQAGYTPIQLYYSTTAAAVPVNTNLADGELAINITDGKLYYKDNGGTVRLLASNATSAPVLSFSAGTTGFTPSTATTGAITLAGTLATTNGGTGLTSFTSGGVVYASSTSALATGSLLSFDGTNLGIGTSSPTTKLDVKQSGANWYDGIEVVRSTTDNQRLVLGNTSGASWIASVDAAGGANNELIFGRSTNGTTFTESARFSSAGNFGIGTSSPTGRLNILQDGTSNTTPALRITGSSGDPSNYYMEVVPNLSGATINYRFNIKNVSTYSDVLVLGGTGNVGIGTSSPSTRLNVNFGALTSGTQINELVLQSNANSVNNSLNALTGITFYNRLSPAAYSAGSFNSSSGVYGINLDNSALGRNMGLVFYTSAADSVATEKMRITSAGYLGIGTTAPNFLVNISTGSTSSITQPTAGSYGLYVQQNTSGSTGGIYIQDGASNSGYSLFIADNNNTARFVVGPDGSVGVGTSGPNSLLQVLGTTNSGYATSNAIVNAATSISNAAALWSGSSLRLTANMGGAVNYTGRGSELVFGADNGNFGSGGGFGQANLGAITAISENGNAVGLASSMLFYTTIGNNIYERLRINSSGAFGIGGANYGTAGQVLTSGGPSAAPTWATGGGGGGSVAGSNGQVQFNNSGSFGASSGLVWDNANSRLSVNSGTSPTESLVVTGRIAVGTNYILTDNVSPTFYISTSGNDTTGNGSNGSPWATLGKALGACAKFMPNGNTNATIVFKNGTYTLSSVQYIRGFTGGGRITIQAETAGSVTVNQNGHQYEIERNDVEIYFNGITFQSATTPSMFNIYDTLTVRFESNCVINQMISGGSPGNFNQAIGVSNSGFLLQATFTVYNEASYGAVINIYGNSTYYFSGTFTKSGAKHGNAAISIQGVSTGTFQNTINNFNIGINMGQSHYNAEQFGIAVANSLSITNCNVGIRLSNNGSFLNYYVASFSGTTTPVYLVNGWYSGTASSEYNLIGYNTSVSSSYRLQVNSQIYATSSTIATSDGRYKKNVASIANGLDIVKALRPVQFDWIPHDIHNFDTEHTTVGFIAQEVKEVLAGTAYVDSIIKPHYITREAEEYETIIITPATEEVIDENGNLISLAAPPVTEKRITKPAVTEEFFGIAEGNLIAILTKAIQEQQVIIEALTARVEALEAI